MSDSEEDFYQKFHRWSIRFLMAAILIPSIGLGLWTWACLKFVYASGERSGFVQKISKKGWLCKTWEGELAMANLPGTMPEIFAFTVHDSRVVSEIEKAIGQRLSLHYEQHRGLPSTCFGDTEYFITAVVPQGTSADVVAPGPTRSSGH